MPLEWKRKFTFKNENTTDLKNVVQIIIWGCDKCLWMEYKMCVTVYRNQYEYQYLYGDISDLVDQS